MTQFVRIEARITDRDEMQMVAVELVRIGKRLEMVAKDTKNDDEAAMLLARDRIKQASQKMRKGLKNVG